jgi:hypothetical protein
MVLIIKKKKKIIQNYRAFTQTIVEVDADTPSLVARREESSAVPKFIVEDLPYHIKRIYAHGENSYQRPWNLKASTQFDSSLDPTLLDEFLRRFNEMARYSKFERWTLMCLRILYYPIYFVLGKWLKKNKFKALESFILKNKMVRIFL